MRVIIAGGGEFGTRLAEELSRGNEVIVVERDESRAEYLGEKLHSIVLYGSATDKTVLRHASAEKCDSLVAATGDDKINSAVCELAKSFGIKKIVSRLSDPSNEGMFSGTGAVTINLMDSAVKDFMKSIGHGKKS